MTVSTAPHEMPRREWLPPGDPTFDHGNAGDGRAVEARDESRRGDIRPEAPSPKQPVPEEKKQTKDDNKPAGPTAKWPFALAGMVVIAFVGVVLWIIFRPRPNVWTDDAYVMVHYAAIAPRVSGQVTTVPVDDNAVVKAAQVLATLDPRDYQTAVAAATAALARDSAQLADVTATLARQPSVIAEQEAGVAAARAALAFTEPDASRYAYLAATDAGSLQQKQRADSALQQSRAQLDNALAARDAARQQLDVIKAQQLAAAAVVESDKAQLEQAKLNLSYTQILAPVDGTVTERSVQIGNTVAPGATLMTVIPLDQVYIVANYREVDLTHVRRGQKATIHVDAYNIKLTGTVNGIAAASGVSFAPIEPNNATGNFTKIVQRLPVKIDVDPGQPLARLLRVGFSVETTIHTGLEDVVGEQRREAEQ
jgi:membrane fusion protein (multidrug efflux system)